MKVLGDLGFDLAYPGRDGVPKGRLRLRLPRPRHGRKRIPQFADWLRPHLEQFSPDPDRALILSEENIPGPMRHFSDGKFFPASGKRLETLAEALPGPPRHLIYVVRSYDQLYVSGYRKRAEDNPVPPFAELVPFYMQIDRGWPELISDVVEFLRPQQVTVIPYERRGSNVDLLRVLVPELAEAPLAEPETTLNLSATDAALEALQARYRAGEELTRKQWQGVIAEHAHDRAPRGVAAFPEADRNRLNDRYLVDLARLSEMPDIRFI